MAYCLIPQKAEEFKKKLVSGEIDPAKLSEMTSKERHDYFSGFLGKTDSLNVNALFESKLLLKNQQTGMINWAKTVSGIKPEVRRDMISRIEKMNKFLDPVSEKAFLSDLAEKRLGFGVTMEEAQKITDFSKAIKEAREIMDVSNYESRIKYGDAIQNMNEYLEKITPSKDNILISVANLPRALQSSMDFSGAGRQAWGMITTPEYWKNIGTMFKTFFSQNSYKEVMSDILSRPTYDTAKKAGLKIFKLGDKLTAHEDAFMTKLADKIPGIKQSQRSYTAFLNKLRMDRFDKLLRLAEMRGEDVAVGSNVTKDLANVVGNFTGAGDLGKFEQSVPLLNTLMYSPRKLAATVNIFNPRNYLSPKISKTARIEAIRNLLGSTGTALTVLSMAKMAGAEVEADPRSADFGKVKVRNTRFDVTGGNGNFAVLLARLFSGKMKSTTTDKITTLGEKYGSKTRGDIGISFLRNKLSPMASFFADWLYGKNAIGDPFKLDQQLLDKITPFTIRNAIDTVNQDPEMAIFSTLADMFGFGTQTYKPTEEGSKIIKEKKKESSIIKKKSVLD